MVFIYDSFDDYDNDYNINLEKLAALLSGRENALRIVTQVFVVGICKVYFLCEQKAEQLSCASWDINIYISKRPTKCANSARLVASATSYSGNVLRCRWLTRKYGNRREPNKDKVDDPVFEIWSNDNFNMNWIS